MTCSRELARWLGAVSLVGLLWATPAVSQIQNGEIVGLVTDPSGAVLVDAVVTFQNPATNRSLVVRTNRAGFYTAKQLLPGSYRVTAVAEGFARATRADIRAAAGTVYRLDFQLGIAPRADYVESRSTDLLADQVNTENARLATTLDAREVAELPLNGRNVYNLVKYVPGAIDVRGVILEEGSHAVVNGVRENFGGFLLNGLSNRDLDGAVVNKPIVDTIEQMQVVTLNNSAEFGNSAGPITSVITKSGTNQFHGRTWWFVRNEVFDANSFFANHTPDPAARIKPAVRLNQFGGSLGGPILKNKLFFFAAYQGERFVTASPSEVLTESAKLRQAVATAFPSSVANLLYSNFAPSGKGIPDLSIQNYITGGAFSGSGFSRFADYLCPANTDGTGVISNKFATLVGVQQAEIDAMNLAPDSGGCPGGSPFATPVAGVLSRNDPLLERVINTASSQAGGDLSEGNEASVRLDYSFGSHHSLFTQMNWARSTDRFGGGNLVRGFPTPTSSLNPNFQSSLISSFGPRLVNELRAGYSASISRNLVTFPGVPSVVMDDGTLGFGAFSELPDFSQESIYTLADSVAINRAKHDMKAGVDLRRNFENSIANLGRPSYYFFDPLFFAVDAPYGEGAGVDPGILSGQPAQLEGNARHWRNWELGLYFEDNWKVTRRLTLNLGLRYDLYKRLTELNDIAATFIKGPGRSFIDDITTGAGQIKNGAIPCLGDPLATIAGECGPQGFAPVKSLGAGDHNNFGPRLGFAWDIFGNGKTSLRGGLGIAYQSAIYRPYSNTRWNPPFYSLNAAFNSLAGDISDVVYGPVDGSTPTFLGTAPAGQHSGTGVQATGNISGWDPTNPNIAALTSIIFPEGLPDPSVTNYFLGIQRELRHDLILEANYVGTKGDHLIRADNVNRIPGGRLPEGTCVTDNFGRKLCSQQDRNVNAFGEFNNLFGRLNPNYGTLRVWRDIAASSYNSLQVSLNGKLITGLQISTNYTYSHAIDSGSAWHNQATDVSGFAAGAGFTLDPTMPNLDRHHSSFDVRHRLTISYVWDLPFFRHSSGLLKLGLADWQLNGIWAFQTGAHWTPYDGRRATRFNELTPGACEAPTFDSINCVSTGGDYNLDGVANDRPNAIADNVNATRAQWADGFNLPANFFSRPCLACAGNLARNTFVGPGYWAADISIFKNFRLRESVYLQFRTEAFNVLNHTNFEIGHNQINDPQFGQAGGTQSPRNLQFAFKLLF